jgi:hypothetical protein
MSHGVGFTTGGGGGGGGGVSDDEDVGAGDEEDTEDGGAVGVSACTAPEAHPATDINATAASSIRIAHPLSDSSFAEVDDGRITQVAKQRARLRNSWETGPRNAFTGAREA